MAAVLACGDGAGLCDADAAALWSIRRSNAAGIDVVVPTAGGRSRPGLRVHRRPSLVPGELTSEDGIPVTTPARTLLELAATLNPDALRRALDRTEILELTDYPALDAMAGTHPNHRGAKPLRAALDTYLAGALTRSELEERLLALCRREGLPTPLANVRIAGLEVDFLFVAQRLVVELDGWRYHRTRHAFERDRARDAQLLAAGYRTLRITHRRLDHVAATLRTLVAPA